MVDVLTAAKLYGDPARRTGKSGKFPATAKVRSAAGDGEALFVYMTAFADCAIDALLTLETGGILNLARQPRNRFQTILVALALRQS